MFILGLFIGGAIGVLTMCLMQMEREDIRVMYKPSCNLPECQIYPDYGCIDSTFCKGNPQLCENAILKEEE